MARIKIVSNGTVVGTKVYADGTDISSEISAVTWTMDARNRGSHVTLTLSPRVDVELEAEKPIDMGFLSLPQEVQDEVNRHAAEKRNDEINRRVRKEWDAEFNGIPIDAPDNPTDH